MTTVGMTKVTAAAKSRSGDKPSSRAGRGSTTTPDKLPARGDAVHSVVLTYELADKHLTASLVDGSDGSQLGDARTMDLEDLAPEQIGLSVPMLWELIDHAKVTPQTVVVLGEVNTSTVSPILELALGVPVIAPEASVAKKPSPVSAVVAKPDSAKRVSAKRVSAAKTEAAVPAVAALVAEKPIPAKRVSATPSTKKVDVARKVDIAKKPAAVAAASTVVNDPPTEQITVVPAVAKLAFAEADVTAPVAAVPPLPIRRTSTTSEGKNRRGLVIVAAATAIVLAGGIGAALALGNGDSQSVPEQTPSASTREATPPASDLPPAPSAALPSPAAVPAPVVAPPAPAAPAAPPAEPAPVSSSGASGAWSNSYVPPPWTPSRAPAAQSPATVAPAAPQSSPSYVPPPQFTVPVPVPDPNNPNATPQQLQDEAWQRHWEQTREYFEQQGG